MQKNELKKKLVQDLLDRSPTAIFGSIALYLILIFSCDLKLFPISWVFCSGVLISVPSLMRFYITMKARTQGQFEITPFRKKFSVLTLISGLGWCILSSWIFYTYPADRFERQLTLLILSGFSSAGLVAYGSNFFLYRVFLLEVLIIPLSLFCYSSPGLQKISYSVIFGLYGAYLYLQSRSHYQNILEKFKNEIKLEAERTLLQTILDTVPGFLSYFDQNLNYVAMNSSLKKLLGVTDADYVGKQVGFLENSDDWTLELKKFALSDRESSNLELRLTIAGEARWYLSSMRKSNDQSWIVCVSIDIHDEKLLRLEAEAQRARSQNTAKMAALGEMSSGIAHEINNPLAIIRGKAQRIQRMVDSGSDKELIRKDIGLVCSTVDRIAKIIKGLRAFARDGSQDAFVTQSVSGIIEDTLSLCQNRLSNHGVTLKVNPFPPSIEVDCRPSQISEVLLNLLGNSFDAIETLEEKWIEISVVDLQDSLQIRVTDSGSGIPSELREKIVLPFFTTKEVGKGTGLGLSISRGIIEGHGGSLDIDVASKNTCFVIQLPKRHREASTA